MRSTRRDRAAAIVLGLALVAGGCSSDEGSTATSTPVTTVAAAPRTTAAATTTDAAVDTTEAASEPTDTAADTTDAAPTTTRAPAVTTATTPQPDVAPATTAAVVDGPSGGTITYAAQQEYTSYNNATADQVLSANTLILNLVQPRPFVTNPDLTLTMWDEMMESVEVTSENPQIVRYVVKEAAVWQDGQPIDCDDFHLAWLAQNGNGGARLAEDGTLVVDERGNPVPVFDAAGTAGYELIAAVECSDDGRTITTTYHSQFVDYRVLFGGLVPAHVVERESGVADLTVPLAPAQLQAVADVWNEGFSGFDPERALSGAWYRISEWNEGESLVLVRNETFYGEPAKADQVVFRLLTDPSDQVAALDDDEVQVISPQPTPELLAELADVDGVVTDVAQGVTFEHLDFNQRNPILADINVRIAIALCIDRQEIVDTLVAPLNPDATVLNNHMFIPSQPEYESHGEEYMEQDIDGAKALLEASGWTLGGDGFYERSGERLRLRLGRRDPYPRRQSTNQLISAQCAEAGIELVDDPAEDFNSVRLPAGDYDIALFAWAATSALASNTSIYTPPAQGGDQNWIGYVNEDLVPLFADANSDFDTESRAATYNEIDRILWDDMATLPLYQFQELVAHRGDIANVAHNGTLGVTWNAHDWVVTPAE